MLRSALFLAIVCMLYSCVSVKEYQKQYLHDPEMSLAPKPIERFESFSETYREGASGAVSGETGGGCGCY